MENATTATRRPPRPPPLFAPPPLSPYGNTSNSTEIGAPPTQLIVPIDNSNITIFMPPAALADGPRRVDLSPLEFILALMAVITIPALIYAFFFAVKCPSWPNSPRDHHQSSEEFSTNDSGGSGPGARAGAGADRVSDPVPVVKYEKESHAKEIGSECPVCLSVCVDGEEVRQLNACKHAFHATCINLWLNNHSNCPICRASVTVKKPGGTTAAAEAAAARRREDNTHQGSPDAPSLV